MPAAASTARHNRPPKGRELTAGWTQDQEIAFTAARDGATHLIGLLNAEMIDEGAKASPDPERPARLDEEITRRWQERSSLSVHDDARVAALGAEWSARIRALAQATKHIDGAGRSAWT